MSKVENFNFLPQCHSVNALLQSCVETLKFVPEDKRIVLIDALRDFEYFCAPTLWSVNDVEKSFFIKDDDEDDLDEISDETATQNCLTDEEKREVMSRFVNKYQCSDDDWMQIANHAEIVLLERINK